jgi:hypothetical protein
LFNVAPPNEDFLGTQTEDASGDQQRDPDWRGLDDLIGSSFFSNPMNMGAPLDPLEAPVPVDLDGNPFGGIARRPMAAERGPVEQAFFDITGTDATIKALEALRPIFPMTGQATRAEKRSRPKMRQAFEDHAGAILAMMRDPATLCLVTNILVNGTGRKMELGVGQLQGARFLVAHRQSPQWIRPLVRR